MNKEKLKYILIAGRPSQWIKNSILFTGVLFAGQLFNLDVMIETSWGFVIFCLLSSTSYILNDIIAVSYTHLDVYKRQTYVSVACASIWAKVSRDAVMKDLAAAHPEYGWDSNVGYGTKAHIQGIQTYGATSYHRKSFLTKMQSSCSKEA